MIFDIRSWCVIALSVLNPITGNLHRGTSMGRRIKKSVYAYDPGKSPEWQLDKSILFVYDGWNVIEEITVEGGGVGGATQSSRYFVWGLDLSGSMQGAGGVGGLLAMVDPGEGKTYHYFYDANGNVGQMVDTADGSVAAHYEYAPFGKVIASHGDLKDENPFRFSTKFQDDETELVYYGYRHYSPELGRWISRDPIGEKGGINLYVFILNNPIGAMDFLGLKKDPLLISALKELNYRIASQFVSGKFADILLTSYIWGNGATLTLGKNDVKNLLKPVASLTWKRSFREEVFKKAEGKDCCPYKRSFVLSDVFDKNNPSGGLGYYSIAVDLNVVACNRKWKAEGTAFIFDRWDFVYKFDDVWEEVKELWANGSRLTRTFYGSFIYGDPFDVESVDIPIKQTNKDLYILWN